jgi:hypothetical protein
MITNPETMLNMNGSVMTLAATDIAAGILRRHGVVVVMNAWPKGEPHEFSDEAKLRQWAAPDAEMQLHLIRHICVMLLGGPADHKTALECVQMLADAYGREVCRTA